MTDSACLAGKSAAAYVDYDIKSVCCICKNKRLANNNLEGLKTEVLVDVSLIYSDLAAAGS